MRSKAELKGTIHLLEQDILNNPNEPRNPLYRIQIETLKWVIEGGTND